MVCTLGRETFDKFQQPLNALFPKSVTSGNKISVKPQLYKVPYPIVYNVTPLWTLSGSKTVPSDSIAIAIGCLIGSIFMFKYELKLGAWGPNIRMAISTVIIFWTTIEVFARNGLFTEFWVDPLGHVPEMVSILVTFLVLGAFLIIRSRRKKDVAQGS